MEYGGITPVGLPGGWRLLVDKRVPRSSSPSSAAGSGLELFLPGRLLADLPGAEVVADLAR